MNKMKAQEYFEQKLAVAENNARFYGGLFMQERHKDRAYKFNEKTIENIKSNFKHFMIEVRALRQALKGLQMLKIVE